MGNVITRVVNGVTSFVDKSVKFVKKVVDKVRQVVTVVKEIVVKIVDTTVKVSGQFISKGIKAVGGVAGKFLGKSLEDSFNKFADKVESAASVAGNYIKKKVTQVFDTIEGTLNSVEITADSINTFVKSTGKIVNTASDIIFRGKSFSKAYSECNDEINRVGGALLGVAAMAGGTLLNTTGVPVIGDVLIDSGKATVNYAIKSKNFEWDGLAKSAYEGGKQSVIKKINECIQTSKNYLNDKFNEYSKKFNSFAQDTKRKYEDVKASVNDKICKFKQFVDETVGSKLKKLISVAEIAKSSFLERLEKANDLLNTVQTQFQNTLITYANENETLFACLNNSNTKLEENKTLVVNKIDKINTIINSLKINNPATLIHLKEANDIFEEAKLFAEDKIIKNNQNLEKALSFYKKAKNFAEEEMKIIKDLFDKDKFSFESNINANKIFINTKSIIFNNIKKSSVNIEGVKLKFDETKTYFEEKLINAKTYFFETKIKNDETEKFLRDKLDYTRKHIIDAENKIKKEKIGPKFILNMAILEPIINTINLILDDINNDHTKSIKILKKRPTNCTIDYNQLYYYTLLDNKGNPRSSRNFIHQLMDSKDYRRKRIKIENQMITYSMFNENNYSLRFIFSSVDPDKKPDNPGWVWGYYGILSPEVVYWNNTLIQAHCINLWFKNEEQEIIEVFNGNYIKIISVHLIDQIIGLSDQDNNRYKNISDPFGIYIKLLKKDGTLSIGYCEENHKDSIIYKLLS